MDYAKLEDEILIRLIALKRVEALGVLYDRYGRMVFSLALNIVGDREAAEEITQDAFTRVWERANTYRLEQASVKTWLVSIARYRAIDELRRRGSRARSFSILFEETGEDFSDDYDLEADVETRLRMQRVRSAVAGLPIEQRQVLLLAYFRGYSHSQIASALGQPLGTVKTRLRLAMKKLRERLREINEEEIQQH